MNGHFIESDRTIETHDAPHEALGVKMYSGFQAIRPGHPFKGKSRIFDDIADRTMVCDIPYEDQCSTNYYFDLVKVLRDLNGEFDRVVEVGVYMGGASVMLAGCAGRFDFDLDLVDLNESFLLFTYERIRRTFPEATGRIRLWHGDLPSYVRHVMRKEDCGRSIIQHDGAHDFNQVVKDLTALSFVRDKLHTIVAQDTHLRGSFEWMNFVDMAIFAVFGTDCKYLPIGNVVAPNSNLTLPNPYQGNYFRPNVAEGMAVPMGLNTFQYPHPDATFDGMFGPDESDESGEIVALENTQRDAA